eukprot:COSAG02_NODE_12260_length_1572_cov_1.251188_1_plen_23_part_10
MGGVSQNWGTDPASVEKIKAAVL